MIPGNINTDLISGADEGGYQISRSLRFNSADSAYLSRTPASAGNRKTWTWSGWFKNGVSGFVNPAHTYMVLFGVTNGTNASTWNALYFNNVSRQFYFADWAASYFISTAVFRDASSWMHVLLSVDTTQVAAANQVKLYINGVLQDGTRTEITQNTDLPINNNVSHNIGADTTSQQDYLYGYLADIHFIDGQALDPTSFTEVDATTGQLVPIEYTGSYGTNGFRLDFSDNSAATATTLGKDRAGSNNWTPNNLSVTAGAGNDSLVDTPTSYGTDTGAGGEVRGNYATLNSLAGVQTLANGNLDFTSVNTDSHRPATIAMTTGKWYCEFTASSAQGVPGLVATGFTGTYPGSTATSWGWYGGGNLYNSGSPFLSAAFTAGDVVQLAFDADSGKLWFGKNGAWLSSGNPAAGTNQTATPGVGTWFFVAGGSSAGSVTLNANFGQRPFAYTAPSGFKALCDTNLPAPTIARPSTVMDVKLYTGNGSTQTISGLGFSPDLVWIKSRTNPASFYFHHLRDTVRGNTKVLYSNDTLAEGTDSAFASFDSAGFTVNSDLSQSTTPYAAWTWDAGSSTVTNTQGSITSQVRANASAGFSIVTFVCPTSGGSYPSYSVGHGLGVAPRFFIAKDRSNGTTSWITYHASATDTVDKYLVLNGTGAVATASNIWGTALPSSTVINLTANTGIVPGSNAVIYAFAPVAGYSAFGSYTGNGSADGPFVYTGMRPRWLLIKASSSVSSGSWRLFDTARDTYNVCGNQLIPNLSDAEYGPGITGTAVDILSNGFKLRDTFNAWNQSSATYIYAAFAENPFQYARAR